MQKAPPTREGERGEGGQAHRSGWSSHATTGRPTADRSGIADGNPAAFAVNGRRDFQSGHVCAVVGFNKTAQGFYEVLLADRLQGRDFVEAGQGVVLIAPTLAR